MTATTSPRPLPSDDDAALLAGIRSGDNRAFEALVRTYGGQMIAVAKRLIRCEHEALDAVQDAMLSAFNASAAFEGTSRLSTWLHRITVNACLMRIRSRRRKRETTIDELLPHFDDTGHHATPVSSWSDGPPEHAESAELRAQVRACIDRLPESYRSILVLRDIEGLDTEETSKVLGCTTANVKTRLHRARQALRKLLEPLFETDPRQ